MKEIGIGTWWSPKEDVRGSFSMRVTAIEGATVYLEAPLWNGHCLSHEASVSELLERWVEVRE
jgi:hypothetical protein